MAKDGCCCSGNQNVFLACSGGSNVGQITNEVAKRLDSDNLGKFFCLAGVGAHISGMVASVRGADRVIVMDGCAVGCAKNVVDHAQISNYEYILVTDMGIEKDHSFALDESEVETVYNECLARLGIVYVEDGVSG